MGKEDLFEGVDLNSGNDGGIDESFFTQDPETREASTEKEVKEIKVAKKAADTNNDEEDSSEEQDGVDPTIFENNDNLESHTSSDDSSADNSSSPLQLVTQTLLAEGLITLEEGSEVKDAKDLIEGWRKKMLENEYSDLNETQKLYLDAIRNGIPEEDVKTNIGNIDVLTNLNEDTIVADENLRTTLIVQNFIAKGLSQTEAAKLAKRSIDLGEDVDDAKEAHISLLDFEKKRISTETENIKKQKQLDIKRSEEDLSKLKETILTREEFIPNVKVNSTTKEKIFKNLTEIAGYDKAGNPINAITKSRLENPDEYAIMESFLHTYTKGFTDFSKFENAVKTSAIEDLDKKLKTTQTGGGSPKEIKSSSSQGLSKALERFKL